MKMGRLSALSVILDIFNRGSRVFTFFFIREEKDAGFPRAREGQIRGIVGYFHASNTKRWKARTAG